MIYNVFKIKAFSTTKYRKFVHFGTNGKPLILILKIVCLIPSVLTVATKRMKIKIKLKENSKE